MAGVCTCTVQEGVSLFYMSLLLLFIIVIYYFVSVVVVGDVVVVVVVCIGVSARGTRDYERMSVLCLIACMTVCACLRVGVESMYIWCVCVCVCVVCVCSMSVWLMNVC